MTVLGIDDRVAEGLRLLALAGSIQTASMPNAGSRVSMPGWLAEHAARIDRELALGIDHAVGHRHAGETDAIGIGRELQVVADVHRLHQEAKLLRQLAAHAANACQQFAALALVDQRHQPEADFESDQIHRLHVVPGQLALLGVGTAGGRGGGAAAARGRGLLGAAPQVPGAGTAGAAEQQEGDIGHARDQSHDAEQSCRRRRGRAAARNSCLRKLAAEVLRRATCA